MALLLNIDTATEVASVCLSLNGSAVAIRKNQHQKEHASFVHAAIAEILNDRTFELKELDAVAVTSGPGSYTGLRVGMASAKGFCYALSKPLIAINTLEVMARAALDAIDKKGELVLVCPMIDARRMEVFAAIYNSKLEIVLPPQPVLVDANSFDAFMLDKKLVFFGSGSIKLKAVKTSENAVFEDIEYNASHLAILAEIAFKQKKFADVSYSEPDYLKAFYTTAKT